MTKQNADNAVQANALMTQTKSAVNKANTSMKQVTQSMAEISSVGQEIGKIIKTIDEIAFQTNLLALNAAVEAARAGEAGAGGLPWWPMRSEIWPCGPPTLRKAPRI